MKDSQEYDNPSYSGENDAVKIPIEKNEKNATPTKDDLNLNSIDTIPSKHELSLKSEHADMNDHVSIPIEKNWKNTITFSWRKINAFALPERGPFKGKHALRTEKQILKDVTGICRPGELVAIMGASGAGKTSLLNVLTSRSGKSIRIEGGLFVNGKKMSKKNFTKNSAYVQQEDLFIGTMKVKEQLVFQANLRMDHHIPREQRMKRVEEVLLQLGLSEARDTLIGIPGRIKGISGGETKRLAFACEVLTNPALMFCDEPTTGLDSFMAQTIVSAMKDLASSGKAIISTIHQPSSEVFALFDRVLLLAEGRLAFLGLTSDGLKFFSRLGRTCPFRYNPADFFISSLAIKPGQEDESQVFVQEVCDEFAKTDDMREIEEAVKNNMGTEKAVEIDQDGKKVKKTPYKAGWFAQLSALNKRCFIEMAREPMLLRIKLIQTVMVALIVGLIYLNTDGEDSYDQSSVQNLNGVLFMFVANLSFQFAFGVVNTFCSQLPIFLREHHNGMYRTDTFYLTKNIAEIPSSIIMPFIFLLVCYFMVNLHRSVDTFFLFGVALILVSNVALSYGYLISCIARDLKMAIAIAAPLLIPLMVFGGFYLNSGDCPNYFIWIQYISWFNYGFEAMVILQWKDVDHIKCNETMTELCYNTGPELIDQLGFQSDGLWVDFVALIALAIFYRVLAYLALLRRSYRGL